MALFGAPVALEDHALRACISALEIQQATQKLAAEVLRRDGVDLQLRVGLNSGEVIAGEIGSGPGRYTAVAIPSAWRNAWRRRLLQAGFCARCPQHAW